MAASNLSSLLAANFLFLSSRRRHTSWPRDWSSDVCSSDLVVQGRGEQPLRGDEHDDELGAAAQLLVRSEERRVGKEWRCRQTTYHHRKRERSGTRESE